MTLIDEGLNNGLEYAHTDYYTGEGRFITRSENCLEPNINPELSYRERRKLSTNDTAKRNRTEISLFSHNNLGIRVIVQYNHANERLSLRTRIKGHNGKKIIRIEDSDILVHRTHVKNNLIGSDRI